MRIQAYVLMGLLAGVGASGCDEEEASGASAGSESESESEAEAEAEAEAESEAEAEAESEAEGEGEGGDLELQIDDTGGAIEAPAAEGRHIAHILIRFRGAERTPSSVTRTQAEARTLAEQIHTRVGTEDFAAVAREVSDDDATREHGGDLGTITRGLLPEAMDDAAFALAPGEVSAVVETPLGFHIIRRLE